MGQLCRSSGHSVEKSQYRTRRDDEEAHQRQRRDLAPCGGGVFQERPRRDEFRGRVVFEQEAVPPSSDEVRAQQIPYGHENEHGEDKDQYDHHHSPARARQMHGAQACRERHDRHNYSRSPHDRRPVPRADAHRRVHCAVEAVYPAENGREDQTRRYDRRSFPGGSDIDWMGCPLVFSEGDEVHDRCDEEGAAPADRDSDARGDGDFANHQQTGCGRRHAEQSQRGDFALLLPRLHSR